MILGIETSCDETAAAVVTHDGRILSNIVSSQADLHARYGGVVPEVASRRHLELVTPVVREALAAAAVDLGDIDLVGVTTGPGLIGALLVGLAAAKAIAWARALPLAPVDHLDGHVASLYLEPAAERPVRDSGPAEGVRGGAEGLSPQRTSGGSLGGPGGTPSSNREIPPRLPLEPPFLCLLASGGHTLLLDVQAHGSRRVLGSTLDDAAGEAFDKGARLLGLGYPGGAEIDRLAREGNAEAFAFPVARVPGLDFSFSGLKTALLYVVRDLAPEELERRRADLAASYQHAIVRALVERTHEAADRIGAEHIAVVGGVAANAELRASLPDAALAPLPLCTDNAAMIASAARYAEPIPYPRYLALDAYASSA